MIKTKKKKKTIRNIFLGSFAIIIVLLLINYTKWTISDPLPPIPPVVEPVVKPEPVKPVVEPVKPVVEPVILVATVNAWDGGKKQGLFTSYLRMIIEQKPDFIFLQEAPEISHQSIKAASDKYEVISVNQPKEKTIYERMMTLRRRSSAWTQIGKTDTYRSSNCDTDRIITLENFMHVSGVNIKIANVHLCGGRFDEEYHCNQSIQSIQDAKLDMLKDVIGVADIILGDFNSDFLVEGGTNLPNGNGRLDFLKNLGCDENKARMWHNLPYQKLQSSGYRRVEFGEHTSAFGTMPDGIWFSNRFSVRRNQVFDALTQNASDHNGLAAEFVVCWNCVGSKELWL